MSEVGTEWVGYATGRRELDSLGKLGAPKVVTTAGQAGPAPLGNPRDGEPSFDPPFGGVGEAYSGIERNSH